MSNEMKRFIHPTAEVSEEAVIGPGTRIWNHAQVRERTTIGAECIIGKDVYIDFDVRIGNRVKVQNGSQIYHGSEIEDGAFVGPGTIMTNDKRPRAINPDGSLQGAADWRVGKIRVCRGASIGAGAILITDIVVGAFAMIGAGAVVTRDIPDHGLVIGNPARLVGFVCACGVRVSGGVADGLNVRAACPTCGSALLVPKTIWDAIQ